MKRLHIVPGLELRWSGIAVAAKMIAREQGAAIVDADCSYEAELSDADEVWVHSVWTFKVWRACWRALRRRKRLVRMLHGNVDPVRLRYHGWKKWLVGPIERFFLRRADRIVATCEAEKGWIEAYLGKWCPPIGVTDIRGFFDLGRVEGGGIDSRVERVDRVDGDGENGRVERVERVEGDGESGRVERVERVDGEGKNSRVERVEGEGKLHLLYLGRRHPLKGLEFLEEAVKEVEGCELRVVSNAFGEEKEKVWAWCDVLVLPTLSENFGLVVAEALERGKRVITTDGAPAWGGDGLEFVVSSLEFRVSSLEVGKDSRVERVDRVEGDEPSIRIGYGGRLLYLVGYRDGTRNERVRLLKEAIKSLVG